MSKDLQEFSVPVSYKLAALWTAIMFCYVYGDYFLLFVPGHIQDLMNGDSGAGRTTPVKLLSFAIMMTFPAAMVFLSLTLPAKLNRWVNVIVGLLFTVIMILVVSTSLGEWMIFYTYLGIAEIMGTSLVVWYAWRWPRV